MKAAKSFTSFDLFSGAGGFSLGLEAAGFRSQGAIEIGEVASRTYRLNFGERPALFLGPKSGDMCKIQPALVARKLVDAGVDELDLLVAGPPCQGFSRVGRGKLDSMAERTGAFMLDPRNHLYRRAIAMVAELQPRVFLFENVAGILHVGGRNVAERVCEALDAIGYEARCALLNAAWYGVPQLRDRLFIVAVRRDLGIVPGFPLRERRFRVSRGRLSHASLNPLTWKNPTYFLGFDQLGAVAEMLPAVTVRQAFEDLPAFTGHLKALRDGTRYRTRREDDTPVPYRSSAPGDYASKMRTWTGFQSQEVTDHFCRWTPRDFETFRRMKPDDRYPRALEIAEERYREARARWNGGAGPFPWRKQFVPPYPNDTFDEKWRKLVGGEPAPTVTAHLAKDTYSHIHFSAKEARGLTIREAARLQSFPDAFRFAGNTGDAFRQIGNAVPPLLAAALGRSIASMLSLVDETVAETGICAAR